ncbi:FAD-dependent oxidoreductase [Pseudactinotalea sp. HY158]|uniref:oxidoreductase n=1 Tax=Pseudactinotalea sp. HY158 TaxID=2654547 RepID=UPI00129CA412|nr:FAD-dependent oxidoreductase [Pseudactinotalea sp. HY158]QGH68749.1 FAD-dependent oxidoreductase [Pseudactinotalea sp. HY158]
MTSPSTAYPTARRPVAIGTLTLPHRIVMGSMHLNRETGDPGALAEFYATRARGGAGLIVTGGAAVSRVGAGGPGYALINDDAHAPVWARVTREVHEAGGLIALQLFHAGRYAHESTFGLRPVAPSAVYSRFSRCEPVALTEEGIADTIEAFAAGAARAFELGFDAVEVMASEGYLLNQFASPLTNRRDDAWGGDAARRRRFPVAVVGAVRGAAGTGPVLVRMSGADLMPGSSTPEETGALAVDLVRAGADALDIGIGWHESPVPSVQSLVPHGVWAGVAAGIRGVLAGAGAAVPVIAAGRVNTLAQAEEILAAGAADLVSMARPFLADPAIVARSFAGRPELVNTCIGCNEACIDRSFGTAAVSCLVNPRAGRELDYPASPVDVVDRVDRAQARAGRRRRVAVVGGGPAGMEAARAAAANGADVTLIESGRRIGGQFLLAGLVPGKSDFLETVRYFENELARLGVGVRLGEEVRGAAGADMLAGFDHVVLATGVRPRRVEIDHDGSARLLDYRAAFADPGALGRRVAVVGAGGIGVDLAHLLAEPAPTSAAAASLLFLARHGLAPGAEPPATGPARQVTIMRRSGSIGAGMGVSTRWAAVQAIRAAGVVTLSGVTYESIDATGVHIRHDGARRLVPADTVVIAAGQEPHAPLAPRLTAAGIPVTVIGGARSTAGLRAVEAFEEGLRAGTAAATAPPDQGTVRTREAAQHG